jgi:hypothetical protein
MQSFDEVWMFCIRYSSNERNEAVSCFHTIDTLFLCLFFWFSESPPLFPRNVLRLFTSFPGIFVSNYPLTSFTNVTPNHKNERVIEWYLNCLFIFYSELISALLIPASVPFRRPKETVGAGHGPNDSSSQQLVSWIDSPYKGSASSCVPTMIILFLSLRLIFIRFYSMHS